MIPLPAMRPHRGGAEDGAVPERSAVWGAYPAQAALHHVKQSASKTLFYLYFFITLRGVVFPEGLTLPQAAAK